MLYSKYQSALEILNRHHQKVIDLEQYKVAIESMRLVINRLVRVWNDGIINYIILVNGYLPIYRGKCHWNVMNIDVSVLKHSNN